MRQSPSACCSCFFFSSRRRHTRCSRDWSSDVCSSDLWRVANPSGDSVTVVTPFHRIVMAARHAAFKNEPLKPDEPEKLLKSRSEERRVGKGVDLGGRRIIKKKKKKISTSMRLQELSRL